MSFRPAGSTGYLPLEDMFKDSYRGLGQVGPAAGNVDTAAIFGAVDRGNPGSQMAQDMIAADAATTAANMAVETGAYNAAMNAYANSKVAELYQDATEPKPAKFNVGNALMAAIPIGLKLATLSDKRVKNTIQELDSSLDLLRELRPVTYYYNKESGEDPTRMHYGFIAQEYNKVLPDAVYQDYESGYYKIDTTDVIALLVSAVQQLEGRLEELENYNYRL